MKKSEIEPGMIVRNLKSGSAGWVRGDRNGRLLRAPRGCVAIRKRISHADLLIGKRPKYRHWQIKNLVRYWPAAIVRPLK